ncbi:MULTISPECIES: YcbJ family phosphotransferase [Tenebrionibacter/Tenebrionicola group]|jgi:hypothetical protein|uniref:YcbJ family phosphotransferase n=2 Tax=Tenebrionibacter/Tenebrionicola group TaxID=2969848 RepID=A0A8K0V3I8_9ENTR|nr:MULTISPECIES: YcbJ family phosphotransferase [Tenebrionibacter/Tenebrionicola group]MBK4714748.1 YcbJ family phosphotransferase [Tenebrionibacter intestinalis]MBV5095493.1 YcbJ family phosphotransferase [Tenebrionicola larvae]
MERLRAELSHLLGEPLSRLECVSETPETTLWSVYDARGTAMPLLAKCYAAPGVASRIAWKMSLLARYATVRMPAVYGVITHEGITGQDVLIIERLRGVSVEAPARTPQRWAQLKEEIIEALLSWHQIDSQGCVGDVDSTQENRWPVWYRQRIDVLWSTVSKLKSGSLTMQDNRLLFRSREALPRLFDNFTDTCVLVHGNFTLGSMLKDARSDRLSAVMNPGAILWAPREYDLFRLQEQGMSESLLWHYLQRAPVAESFLWRRWLYILWNEVARLVSCGRMNRPAFDAAAKALLPWL